MFRSKYMKIIAIVFGLLVLSGIGFYVFNQKNNTNTEQVASDNVIQETTVKEEVSKEETLNPVKNITKKTLNKMRLIS